MQQLKASKMWTIVGRAALSQEYTNCTVNTVIKFFRQNNIACWNIILKKKKMKEKRRTSSTSLFFLPNPSMHARTLSSKLWFPVFQEIHLTWKSLFSNSNARLAAGFYSGIWGAATKHCKLSPAFVNAQQLRIWPVPSFIPNLHCISPDLLPSSPSHLHTTDIPSTHRRRKSLS